MTYAGGQAGPGSTSQRWPGDDDRYRRQRGPRADPVAFVLLVIAGSCGLGQYLISGYPLDQSSPGGSVVTGRQLLSLLTATGTPTADIARIALLVTTVGGGALILLALATLLPINHRPLGAAALLLGLGGTASSMWFLAQASKVLGSPMSALLSGDHLGWYLTVAMALIGVAGSFKALGG